jgi:hypothetical protein
MTEGPLALGEVAQGARQRETAAILAELTAYAAGGSRQATGVQKAICRNLCGPRRF